VKLNAYLTFAGDCAEAFQFYEQCLGGKIAMIMRYGDYHGEGSDQIAVEERDKVMHARLEVSDQVLMGSDTTAQYPYQGIQGAHVTINLEDPVEADRIFSALAEGGQVEMPIQETFWALRYGITKDRFGVPWMINCGRPE
jgi:PhnB protein